MFWAATPISVPANRSATVCRAVCGGQMTTSTPAGNSRATRSSQNAAAAALVLFIFQFAAITERLAGVIEDLHAGEGLSLEQLERRASARRQVRDRVREPEALERGGRVAAAHDRRPFAGRDRLG